MIKREEIDRGELNLTPKKTQKIEKLLKLSFYVVVLLRGRIWDRREERGAPEFKGSEKSELSTQNQQ